MSVCFLFFCLFFVFFCPSRYDARHRKPRRCVYALNLGGTGISPPDSFSIRSSFRSSSTTSGDIFYCSGSRQLNHSSIELDLEMWKILNIAKWVILDALCRSILVAD